MKRVSERNCQTNAHCERNKGIKNGRKQGHEWDKGTSYLLVDFTSHVRLFTLEGFLCTGCIGRHQISVYSEEWVQPTRSTVWGNDASIKNPKCFRFTVKFMFFFLSAQTLISACKLVTTKRCSKINIFQERSLILSYIIKRDIFVYNI